MKYLLPFFILFISCRNNTDYGRNEALNSNSRKDTNRNTSLNYPLFPRGYYIKMGLSNIPHIDSIESGYDSIQIRIWQIQGMFDHRQLFVFKYDRKQWTGYFYELMLDSNYGNGLGGEEFLRGPLPFDLTKFKKITPKMGWRNFIDSLYNLRIMDLPDYTEVPGLNPKYTHPTATYVEIATSKTYRYYTYLDVESFSDKTWQAEFMSRILELLYDQLGGIPRFA